MLSIISLVAYVLTKIAVGIFAGGIVFRTLLPELQFTIGERVIDSFWIGSILVIVLTGVYTVLGGFRAVAYTEAVNAAQSEAQAALNQEQVPKAYRHAVRDYFDDLKP